MKRLISLVVLLGSFSVCAKSNSLPDRSDIHLSEADRERAINFVYTIRSTNEFDHDDYREILEKRDGIKDMFLHRVLARVRKYNGRVSAALNPLMLDLKGSIEIIKEEADDEQTVYKTVIDIDGDRIIHGPYFFASLGTLSFGLYNEDGNPLKLEKAQSDRQIKSYVSFGPKDKTAYILEGETDYRARINTIQRANTNWLSNRNHRGTLPITGPYVAKIEFNYRRILNITLYEILPDGKIKNAGTINTELGRINYIN